MSRYEIQSGTVEQDGTEYGPGDTVDFADSSVAHLREHTDVELAEAEDEAEAESQAEGDTESSDGDGIEETTSAVAEADTNDDTDDEPFLALTDIGEARAATLRENGYESFDAIAAAFVDDIATINGISESLARTAIDEAGEFAVAENTNDNESGSEE